MKDLGIGLFDTKYEGASIDIMYCVLPQSATL